MQLFDGLSKPPDDDRSPWPVPKASRLGCTSGSGLSEGTEASLAVQWPDER